MIDFDRTDVNAVHAAFWEAYEDAEERRKKGMSNSAEARSAQAANLKRLRDKILSLLSEQERASYLDYVQP